MKKNTRFKQLLPIFIISFISGLISSGFLPGSPDGEWPSMEFFLQLSVMMNLIVILGALWYKVINKKKVY